MRQFGSICFMNRVYKLILKWGRDFALFIFLTRLGNWELQFLADNFNQVAYVGAYFRCRDIFIDNKAQNKHIRTCFLLCYLTYLF